jgi:hypothetical protein
MLVRIGKMHLANKGTQLGKSCCPCLVSKTLKRTYGFHERTGGFQAGY